MGKCITFKVARQWCKCSIAEFGEYLDLYDDETAYWAAAPWFSDDEETRNNPTLGQHRHEAWARLAEDNNYNPSRFKSTKIRDPLHRYHRILSHTITQRGQSEGVVNLRDLLCLDSIVSQSPVNLGYLFAQLFSTNARASRATPLFWGAWIVKIYEYLGFAADGTFGDIPRVLDFNLCESMGMVTMVPGQGPRFIDQHGHVWDPEDPNQIFMELEPPQPQQQSPPFQRHPSPTRASSSHADSSFSSMRDLYDAVHQSSDYSRRAYEQAQSTHEELLQWGNTVTENFGRIDESIAYMRGRMDHYWPPNDGPSGN